mmetsp:Transcript_18737/g.38383  ORF Transcript_18737/g.38383 Transcript_18737/m.38383 type:complete len:204 (+) Transcript_18737:1387-1998(+)
MRKGRGSVHRQARHGGQGVVRPLVGKMLLQLHIRRHLPNVIDPHVRGHVVTRPDHLHGLLDELEAVMDHVELVAGVEGQDERRSARPVRVGVDGHAHDGVDVGHLKRLSPVPVDLLLPGVPHGISGGVAPPYGPVPLRHVSVVHESLKQLEPRRGRLRRHGEDLGEDLVLASVPNVGGVEGGQAKKAVNELCDAVADAGLEVA